ncbi:hypothetical protein [Streptomyces sp. NPDC057418]|uniref:hypothetical protein n=1 Tax=unclassified Streptomyces TaxID=2593676 RepID=UPI003691523D
MSVTTHRSGPAGAWSARITRPRGTLTQTFHFTADGQVFMATGGAGTWTATGPGTFAFRLSEPVFDEHGDCVAWVAIDQRAVQHGDEFTSEGRSTVTGSDGNPLRTVEVAIAARARYSGRGAG